MDWFREKLALFEDSRLNKLLVVTLVVGGLAVLAAGAVVLAALLSPPETPVAVSIAPAEITLCSSQALRFTAAGVATDTLHWEADGGTIDAAGLYTASANPGNYVVRVRGETRRQRAEALVHVVACAPTATPRPTATPTLLPSPTPSPTPTPTPVPAAVDPQGDPGEYLSGAAMESVPAGLDISGGNLQADGHVLRLPRTELPAELQGWVQEDEFALWLTFHDVLPETSGTGYFWQVLVDADGDPGTGRPPGSSRVQPDLGVEFAVGAGIDPAESSEILPYLLIWDAAVGQWAEAPGLARFTVSADRRTLALAVPAAALTEQVSQTAGVTLNWGALRGRAVALNVGDALSVADFFPDLPQ